MPKKPNPESASILDAVKMLDTMTTDSSDSDSETESQLYPKPRNLVQRRATITGASPTSKHGINIEQFWKELKREHNATVQLRDKAASCAHGLDNVPMVNIRPQTCLGLESAKKKNKTKEQTNKKVQFKEKLTDAKNTRPDDTKENITPTQNCDDDGANIVNKDINVEHLQASMDNVIDSNNLNNTTVPLDESNTSISDTCSINESMPNNKEIGMQYVERRDKLDKNCSTSAYDLLDTEKLDLSDHCLLKIPNNNLTKTDIHKVIENVDDHKKLKDISSEHKETSARRCNGNVAQKISNIEKQIAHKNAEEQACAFGVPKRIDSHKDNIHVTINDVNLENSTEEKNKNDFEHDISDVNDKKYVKRLSIKCENVINECSKTIDLKNSVCEYHENADCGTSEILNSKGERSDSNSNNSSSNNSPNSPNSSSSNSSSCSNSNSSSSTDDGGDGGSSNSDSSNSSSSISTNNSSSISHSNNIERNQTVQKFDKILQTVNCTSTQHAELLEKKFSSVLSKENCAETKVSPNNNTKFIEDDLSNITHNVLKMQTDIKQQTKEMKSADSSSAQATVQSCRYIELPKIESVRKLENKSHATPPEPPPRKYYTNQAITDLKLNNIPQTLEDSQKPQVPERLGIKREFKKVDLNSGVNHIKDKKDSDVCVLNYTENSTDLIDELRIISLSDQKFDRSNLSDASLYNESSDKQSREEKCPFEKYETFVEKFVCSDQSITDCYRFDHSPRNVDCPDGITHSKQTISSDLKPRLSEKDKSIEKSVVNRAMMVAKSIGLHSSLNKSNSSPRSNRKRNVLLASKYKQILIFLLM